MVTLTNHLVRRGVEEFHSTLRITNSQGTEEIAMPAWGGAMIVSTILFFIFALFAIEYTYAEVVATLAAVEVRQQTTIVETVYDNDSDQPDAPLLKGDEKGIIVSQKEVLNIKQPALTSRFCTIKRHLVSRGGRLARFRGLGIYFITTVFYNIFVSMFVPILGPTSTASTFIEITIYTMLTRYHLLWNHIVISEPSNKSLVARFPSKEAVRKAVVPTAISAAITQYSALAFMTVYRAFTNMQSKMVSEGSEVSFARVAFAPLVLFFIGLFLTVAVQIPTQIAIVRVRASLLPEDDQPIVPFDRTFNGQVVDQVWAENELATLWKAWAGCEIETRLRVLGVYAKTMALQAAVILAAVVVIAAELRLVLGEQFSQRLASAFMVTMTGVEVAGNV